MKVLLGDCLVHLPMISNESVQLVYLDPPFFTQKTHALRTRDNSTEYRFEDRWHSLTEYLAFIRKVLIHGKRILTNSGSLFLHCDRSASHHLRLLLDEVFGSEQFQSEIIWAYRRWSNSKKGLLNAHQTIYFYSKTPEFKFNTLYTDYSPTTNVDQILQTRVRNEFGKAVYQRDDNGDLVCGREKKGVPLADVWNIPLLNPKAKERTGYPTQKPILLLERIIEIASDKGDYILDPFCGSGTTLVAAKLLERSSIGIDISDDAVRLAEQRLFNPIKSTSSVLIWGEESYRQKPEYERTLLKALDAIPIERNSGIDGLLKTYLKNNPIAVRIQKPDEDLESAKQKLIKASQAKKCSAMILVRTHRRDEQLFATDAEASNLMVIDSYDLIINDWLHWQECSIPLSKTFPSETWEQ